MAGHSQFKNIMYRKGAQDKKRAKLFAKLGRELMVAAKESGPDPSGNPRLRSAIATARSNNMPKDNIDRAIARGSGDRDGATDMVGCAAGENRMHVHDLHATILNQMGLDHEQLTYRYSGRDYRLTDVHGKVVKDVIA